MDWGASKLPVGMGRGLSQLFTAFCIMDERKEEAS